MRWLWTCLVAVFVCSCYADDSTVKIATVHCFKDEATNTFDMLFKLDMNNEGQGGLWALNNTEIKKVPFIVSETACSIAYNATNQIYTVTSKTDLSTTSTAQDNNVCGRVKTVDGSTTYWEWYFIHLNTPPAMNELPVLRGVDRIYKAICYSTNLTSNVLMSNVTVSSPNLNQQVTPTSVNVEFKVQKKNLVTNTYTDITSSETVTAGTTARLRLTYTRPTNYDEKVNLHSIYGYNAIVSFNADLSNAYQLIHVNGCANVNGENRAPSYSLTGFKGSFVGNVNNHYTGDFFIWKHEDSNLLAFRTYFGRCFFGDTTKCTDPCLANTQATEPITTNRRKRRQAEENDAENPPEEATVFIRVRLPEKTPEPETSASNVMVIVGAAIGASVLVILAMLVCMFVLMRHRRQTDEKKKQNPNFPVVVPNDYSYKY